VEKNPSDILQYHCYGIIFKMSFMMTIKNNSKVKTHLQSCIHIDATDSSWILRPHYMKIIPEVKN